MSVVLIVLPKAEDGKKVRKILMSHGFSHVFAYPTASALLQEVNQYSCGLVISGYRLKDMYYRELAESLPPYFDLVLMGSASTISEADTGILSLATPLKVYDLVNTVGMVLTQLERRLRKKKKAEKEKPAGRELYPQCEIPADGTKSSFGRGSAPLYSEVQYGQRNQHGGNSADDFDADV